MPRPQGSNSAVFFDPYRYLCPDCDDCYQKNDKSAWNLWAGYRYDQSFKDSRIADCLFGSTNIALSGSHAQNKEESDWLADNFGLSPYFEGNITFNPRIQNNIIDMMLMWAPGSTCNCLSRVYAWLNASLVRTTWDLRACTYSNAIGTNDINETLPMGEDYFPYCAMSAYPEPTTQDLKTALSGNYLFGNMQTEWQFGRFSFSPQSTTRVANVDAQLGFNVIQCEKYHLGIFARASAPTGTQPNAKYIFEPIAGNGHHWELGGGLDAHCTLWHCDDQCLQFHVNGWAAHLFKDNQWRTFDFKPGANYSYSGDFSRYVLLKEYNSSGFATGHLMNAVNFTTRKINSSFSLQGDASARLLYQNCNWALGVGYNIFGRSREQLSTPCNTCNEYASKYYGIKGVTGVCALQWNKTTKAWTGDITSINASESEARMYNIDGMSRLVDHPEDLQDSEYAYLTWDSPRATGTSENDLIIAEDSQENGEPAPVVMTSENINFTPIPQYISHKFFGHFDYAWRNHECFEPYVGIGGEVEFAQNGACEVCTLSLWGVWVRGGFNF